MTSTETVDANDQGIPVWRRASRRRASEYGPLYSSGYIHAFLTGRLEDGREIALAAGMHSRNYPFHHPDSKWDDLLLLIGGEAYLISGRSIPSLGMTLGPREAATVSFNGRVTGPDGHSVQLDFMFNLSARTYKVRPQGIGIPPLMLGLLWQPALVVGNGAVTIQDVRLRVPHVVGEMERGSLHNLRGSMFQFGYEYLAITRAGEVPAAYVEFHTYALNKGLAGWPLRLALRLKPARESITLEGDRPREGDSLSLRPHAGTPYERLIGHEVKLGPAVIQRQIVRVGTTAQTRVAFHERMLPPV